jgi:hypothetical protein
MNEAYVSYETAKLLKEKGFNGYCHVIHINNHNSLIGKVISNSELTTTHEYKFCKDQENCITIPTQQMACRWLREVYNIFIGVDIGGDIDGKFGYMPFIHILDNLSCPDGKYVPQADADDICDFTPQIYEEAVEFALLYALKNLI